MAETRTIHVDYLARVEGEGALTIRLDGDTPTSVELRIFEPPRFFEAFLRGRRYSEAPDITARICGICPVAYQMSAVTALEAALGLTVDPAIRALRRLLYAGEWIESHGLHAFMLHLPDFLGFEDALAMAKVHPEVVKRALRIKKAGNEIVRVLGGREIHPINVRVGGFYRAPELRELTRLVPELTACREIMHETTVWMSTLEFPDLERDYEFVALRAESGYPFEHGRIVSNRGLDISAAEYDDHFEEEHVARSNALHSRIKGRGAYLCGPLARLNLNFDRLSPAARATADAAGFAVPCLNPFRGLLARGIELVQAFDEALSVIAAYERPLEPATTPNLRASTVRASTGFGCTEAPRGILYHRYRIDEDGFIQDAKIVPPTSQNQRAIEEDLMKLAPTLASMPLDRATWLAEQAVRNYDPCISCATHFLKLRVERT